MSTKRTLSRDSRDASAAAKCSKTEGTSPPHPSSTTVCGDRVTQALRFGVLEFLTIPDVTMLLSCCKPFWTDSELAKAVLDRGTASEHVSHLFRKCCKNWFTLDPTRIPLGYEEFTGCGHDNPYSYNDDMIEQFHAPMDTATRPQVHAQLVSLIATMEKLILPPRPEPGEYVSLDGHPVFAVPVAISLWDHHPDKQNLQAGHDWTREDVRMALNAIYEGFGDRFAEEDPAKAFATEFGAHWENIQMKEDGSVECTFCGRHKSCTSSSEKSSLLPFPEAPGWAEIDLYSAARASSDVCSMYALPLKRSLLKYFKFANRIEYPWLDDAEHWCDEMSGALDVELLAGVSASGFLCGSFYVVDMRK